MNHLNQTRNPNVGPTSKTILGILADFAALTLIPPLAVTIPVVHAKLRDTKASLALIGLDDHHRKMLQELRRCSKQGMRNETDPDDLQVVAMNLFAAIIGTEVLFDRLPRTTNRVWIKSWLADLASTLRTCREAGIAEWRIRAILLQPILPADQRPVTPWVSP